MLSVDDNRGSFACSQTWTWFLDILELYLHELLDLFPLFITLFITTYNVLLTIGLILKELTIEITMEY